MAVIVPFETPGASIEELVALVAPDMERVNATILSRTGSDVTMIPEVANHLISSGGKRLRPVLMTALMAGLGLLPAALSHGIGSETQRPFAVVIVGGIVSGTLFTLLLLPLMFHRYGAEPDMAQAVR